MFTLYKNAKNICVAICFGFPHSLTGLKGQLAPTSFGLPLLIDFQIVIKILIRQNDYDYSVFKKA